MKVPGGIDSLTLGIIMFIVIIVVVDCDSLVVVRHNRKRNVPHKRAPTSRADGTRVRAVKGRRTPSAEAPRPKQTGWSE